MQYHDKYNWGVDGKGRANICMKSDRVIIFCMICGTGYEGARLLQEQDMHQKQTPQQRQNEKRRELPRLSPMYLSALAMLRLEELTKVHGSKKAALEFLLLNSDKITCAYK